MKLFFAYSSMQDNTLNDALAVLHDNLIEKKFSSDKEIFTNYDGTNAKHQRAELHLKYLPFEFPAFHDAAIFIYMGIGGTH